MRIIIISLILVIFLSTISYVLAYAPIQSSNNSGMLYFGTLNMTIEEAIMGLSSATIVDNKVVVVSLKMYENRQLVDTLYISIFNMSGINIVSQKILLPVQHIGIPYSLTTRKISNDTLSIIILSSNNNKPYIFLINYNVSSRRVIKSFASSLLCYSIFGFSNNNTITLPKGIIVSLSNSSITKYRDYNNFFVIPMVNANEYLFFGNITNMSINGDTTIKYILQIVRNGLIINGSIISFGYDATFNIFNFYNYEPINELGEPYSRTPNAKYLYPRINIQTTYVMDDESTYILLQPHYEKIVNYPIHFILIKVSRINGKIQWANEYIFTGKLMNSNEFYAIHKIENSKNTINIYLKVYNLDKSGRYVLYDSIRDSVLIVRINKINGYIQTKGTIYNSGLVMIYSTSSTYALISDVNFENDKVIVTIYDKRYPYAHHFILDYETPGRTFYYYERWWEYIYSLNPTYIYYYNGMNNITYDVVSKTYANLKKEIRVRLYGETYYIIKQFYETGYEKCDPDCRFVLFNKRSNLINVDKYIPYPEEKYIDNYDLRIVYGSETDITKYGVGYKIIQNDPRFRVIIIPYKFVYRKD